MNGVLLINLGTPDSPEPRDVKRYLTEFLTDVRVIDLPWLKRNLLVRGIIIPNRYKESAAAYQSIWTEEGSPLLVNTKNICDKLQTRLGSNHTVVYAMRYQNPSMQSALKKLKGCTSLTVIPLFPQYASATTGSIIEELFSLLKKEKSFPNLSIHASFADHPLFIEAAAAQSGDLSDYDVVMSFHGLPVRQLDSGCLRENCCSQNSQCYRSQCFTTARALAKEIGRDDYHVAFQSRLGKEPWIKPFTSDVLTNLAVHGRGKVAVFCPSFVCDCLETLEEIALQYEELYRKAGGDQLKLIPCVNDHDLFIECLSNLATPLPHQHHTCVPL